MNRELTERLVKRLPILYQDHTSPKTQTAMCRGFDHGYGWFEIIWQLSLAIEEELGYSWLRKRWFLFKKSFFRSWNAFWDTSIWRLGCSNHSKIRSARKCYPCSRYKVSPMCPGWTR
jgi:hypothetical protein